MASASNGRRRIVVGAVLMMAVAFVTYARVVTFDFAYDDAWTVVQNRSLERPLSDLITAMARGAGVREGIPDATRPAMVVSVWIDKRLWGPWPGGYHLQSLVWFALASAAAGLAGFALTRRVRIALVTGLFFAVAPSQAEAVSAINYREDLISGVGVLVPLACVLWPKRELEEPSVSLAAAAVFFVGLSAKENAPVLVALLCVAAVLSRPSTAFWRRRERVLFFLGSALILWLSWRAALSIGGDDIPRAATAPWLDRTISTARFCVRSVGLSLAPVFWSPEYSREGPAGAGWLYAAIALVAGVVMLARRRSTRPFALGIAVAFVAPILASPLVGPVNARADRYLLLSVFGGGICWGFVADRVARRIRPPWRIALLAAGCGALALASQAASAPWKNELALWTAATTRAPLAPRAWAGLSRAQRLEGDLDAANRSAVRAVELDSRFVPARVTKAYAHLASGDVIAAKKEIAEVRRLGGERPRGLSRAIRCADLPADEAKPCIAGQGTR